MRIKCIFLVILIFIMIPSYAQEGMLPAGGEGAGSGGSVSFSLGQILQTCSGGEEYELMHGVQQPYEISIVSSPGQFKEIGLALSTYPNPADDFLVLKVDSHIWEELEFEMYNSEGKILLSGRLMNAGTNIDMSPLTPGMYLLRVSMKNEPVKTFKIIRK